MEIVLLPLREKVVGGCRPDEGYCAASLERLVEALPWQGLLRDTPHPTYAKVQTNLCEMQKFAAAKATFPRKGGRNHRAFTNASCSAINSPDSAFSISAFVFAAP
jgi:hypothetical protein